MRLNKYLAEATGISRRKADDAIAAGRATVNGTTAALGQQIAENDKVTFNGRAITSVLKTLTVMLNKPPGYVCSRHGQGSKTIYDLLPSDLHHLKPVGRLDKDSSGLLLLTNNGQLAYELTHPKFQKAKVYEVRLDRPLVPADIRKLKAGVQLEDGISKLDVRVMRQEVGGRGKSDSHTAKTHTSELISHNSAYEVRITEGRNRQIRRTFAAQNYKVTHLHRTQFGSYILGSIKSEQFAKITQS